MAIEDELLDRIFSSADRQVDLNAKVLANHLEGAERIHARQASETLVKMTERLALNPTS